MGLVSELKRRNVFRVAIAHILIAWVILEAGDILAPALHLPEWVVAALVFFLVLGFPLALVFAWAFELTAHGTGCTDEQGLSLYRTGTHALIWLNVHRCRNDSQKWACPTRNWLSEYSLATGTRIGGSGGYA